MKEKVYWSSFSINFFEVRFLGIVEFEFTAKDDEEVLIMETNACDATCINKRFEELLHTLTTGEQKERNPRRELNKSLDEEFNWKW